MGYIKTDKLTKDFWRYEFACNCGCGFDTVDFELLTVLQRLRDYFNAVVTLNSGCRCIKYNKEVGGADNSQHLLGRAGDITVKGVSPPVVYAHLDSNYPLKFGIGLYETFVHIDTRNVRARW